MGSDVSMIGGGTKREWPDVMWPDGDGKTSTLRERPKSKDTSI